MTAMIRNLGKMSSIGILEPLTDESERVCEQLRNEQALKDARIHPFNVLIALKQYATGHGDKGSLKWEPVSMVQSALDDAFYKSFKVKYISGDSCRGGTGCMSRLPPPPPQGPVIHQLYCLQNHKNIQD